MTLAQRIVIGLGIAFGLVTAIHLPPISGWLGITGRDASGCPFGFDRANQGVDARLRGVTPARARPALGFALDVTTVAEVHRWSEASSLGCATKHGGTLIECARVPASVLPAGSGALGLTAAWFQFTDHGTLASIKTVRRDPSVARVGAAFAELTDAVTAAAGPATTRDGSAAPAVLASGALRQAMVEYRFTDYRAVVRATNMGDGFVLSEEYATLLD